MQEALGGAVVATACARTQSSFPQPLSPGAQIPGGDSGSPLGGGPGARVCVCWEGGPPRGRPCASASPSPGAHGPSPSPEAAQAAAEQPRLSLPRFLPPALPRPGLQRLPLSSSRRESGSERARGRAEAAWFGVAAPERGAREDAGPPLRVCSLAPRLPHSARSHPFPA